MLKKKLVNILYTKMKNDFLPAHREKVSTMVRLSKKQLVGVLVPWPKIMMSSVIKLLGNPMTRIKPDKMVEMIVRGWFSVRSCAVSKCSST